MRRKVCLLIGIRSIWLSRSRCKDERTFPKCGAVLGYLCPRPVMLRRSPQWGFYPPHNPMYQHGKCINFYQCAHSPSYQHGKSIPSMNVQADSLQQIKIPIFFPKFLSINFLSAAFCIKLQMVEKTKVLKLTRLWSLISPSPLLHRESRWSDFVHPAPISSVFIHAHYVQFVELVVLN